MKRFLKFLRIGAKIAGKAAPEVLAVVNPPLGALADWLTTQIVQAEADHGAGKGAEKKMQVLDAARLSMPLLIPLIERMTGNEIDDELFVESLSKLIDGFVGLMNSMKQLPKAA